jgi:hypothetical protein
MESIKYLHILKGQVIPGLILILVFAAGIASADVSISNSYYTSGSESHEDVFLHNVDYSNSVSIFNDNYNANAKASTSNQSEDSEFTNTVLTNSLSGTQGLGLEVRDAKDMKYSRTLVGESEPFTKLTYDVESVGREDSPAALQIRYFSPQSLFINDIYNLANNKYAGMLQSYGPRAYMSGLGESIGASESSFNDTISYIFNGKDIRMESFLREDPGDKPVEYWWATFLNQASSGVAGIDMSASAGNFAQFGIRGSSSAHGPKLRESPGAYPGDNTYVEPEPEPDDTVPDDDDVECDGALCPDIDIDDIIDDIIDEETGYDKTKDAFLPHMIYEII